jgi:methionyl aminopeptidase
MPITIKTPEEIEKLREGGRRLATIVERVGQKIEPGMTTQELDDYAQELIKEYGDTSAFLGYQTKHDEHPYPGALCVSVNEGVVHGAPSEDVVIQDGDVVKIDCGLVHEGLYTDHARTFLVGNVSDEHKKMVNITREALRIGIAAAKPGNTTGDIGHAIEKFIDGRYGNVRTLAGHGVGYEVHEEPLIPNYGQAGEGVDLVPGMVVAIEPMLTMGSEDVKVADDGFTFVTTDGSIAAHEEHTLVITDEGPEVLTKT